MQTRAIVVLGVGLFVSAFAGLRRVAACDCVAPPSAKESLEGAAAVFTGTVVGIETDEKTYTKTVTLVVDKVWKGELGEKVAVTTALDGGACGFDFVQKSEKNSGKYLVYAFHEEGGKQLHTHICTRTNSLENAAEDIKELGEPKAAK